MKPVLVNLKDNSGVKHKVSWFNLDGTGQTFSVVNLTKDWYDGPKVFDYSFIDFGKLFVGNVASYIKDNFSGNKDLTVAFSELDGEELDEFNQHLSVIKSVANKDKVGTSEAKAYLASLMLLTEKIISNDLFDSIENVLLPMRGAAIVANGLLRKKDKDNFLKNINFISIDCKRVPLKDEEFHFGFGMNLSTEIWEERYRNLINSNVKDIAILEVASASGITVSGMLLDLYMRGVRELNVMIVSLFISKQFYISIQNVARELGFNVRFYTGFMVSRLGNFYEEGSDSLLYDDGTYVVGNATRILSEFMYDLIKEVK